MIYLVDTVTVDLEYLDRYLGEVRDRMVMLMTGAGATFCSLRTTGTELGEAPSVETTWSFADNAAWNEIRKNLVLDPRWYESSMALAAWRRRGTRRFLRPVEDLSA